MFIHIDLEPLLRVHLSMLFMSSFFPSAYTHKEQLKTNVEQVPSGKSFFTRSMEQTDTIPTVKSTNTTTIVSRTKRKLVQKPVIVNHVLDIKENNILDIDKVIKHNFLVEKGHLDQHREALRTAINLNSKNKDEHAEYINQLRRKIKDIESSSSFILYLLRSHDTIEEYKTLILTASNKNFITQTTNLETLREDALIFVYLSIAQLYINIDGITQLPKKMLCECCGNSNFAQSYEDDSIYICKICQTEKEILDDTPSFKDTDRVNMASKYTYTRKGHFTDAVKKFQGTQNTDPKKIKHVTDVLHQEIDKHNLTAKQGMKNSVTKDHIYGFLSEQQLACHYDDVNLLFHIVTGEPCPDISHIIDRLTEDFDKLEEVLTKIKDENRSNSLTVNYKLYKLLQKWGFPCRKCDFYILKTKMKEDEHDEKMKEAWEVLGWDWLPTF